MCSGGGRLPPLMLLLLLLVLPEALRPASGKAVQPAKVRIAFAPIWKSQLHLLNTTAAEQPSVQYRTSAHDTRHPIARATACTLYALPHCSRRWPPPARTASSSPTRARVERSACAASAATRSHFPPPPVAARFSYCTVQVTLCRPRRPAVRLLAGGAVEPLFPKPGVRTPARAVCTSSFAFTRTRTFESSSRTSEYCTSSSACCFSRKWRASGFARMAFPKTQPATFSAHVVRALSFAQ